MAEPKNICGRCGYDLAGIVESWGDEHADRHGASCPLTGTCSECGFEFAWRDVFNAWRLDQPWLIEHAEGKRTTLKRVPATAWRMMRPWQFWKPLSMQARVRPWAAAVVLLMALVPLHVAVGGYETARLIRQDFVLTQRWSGPAAPLGIRSVPGIIASAAGGPVVRPWLVANSSRNMVVNGVPPPPPTSSLVTRVILETLPWWLLSGLAMILAWVLLLALLPATRATCRLRWAHVSRAAVYSAAGTIAIFELGRLVTYIPAEFRYDFEWPMFLLLAAWLSAWWGSAVTLGWQMRHGPAVALLLGLAAMLAGLTAGVLYDPYLFIALF